MMMLTALELLEKISTYLSLSDHTAEQVKHDLLEYDRHHVGLGCGNMPYHLRVIIDSPSLLTTTFQIDSTLYSYDWVCDVVAHCWVLSQIGDKETPESAYDRAMRGI